MSLQQPDRRPVVSDLDRDQAAAVVQEALVDGRLDLADLDSRLALVYRATTQLELHAATGDLLPVAHGGAGDVLTIRAKGASQKREGRWLVPPNLDVVVQHSSVRLDFTEAIVRGGEIRAAVTAQHSSVLMIVPEGWSIDLDDVELVHGTAHNKAAAPQAGAVRLRVSGVAEHGTITVRHPWKRRRWWPRRRT
jgi:hypothetical protein